MIDLSEQLESQVRPYVNGVPMAILKAATVKAIHKFADESGTWTEQQVLDAYDDELLLTALDPINTDAIGVKWVKSQGGNPINFTFSGGKIRFDYPLNQKVIVRVKLANNIGSRVVNVPNWMYNQHLDALMNATVYFIKIQAGTPWADGDGAAFHLSEYKNYLGTATIAATPKRVQQRPWV